MLEVAILMENTSKIGMGFLEKLIAILFPVVLGTIGWFLPNLLELVKRIPVFSESKVIELQSNLFYTFF